MTNYRPEGYTTLTPMLVVTDGSAAIDFYEKVFGAKVAASMTGPDGTVLHAELELEDGRFQVMDANPAYRMVGLDRDNDDVPYSLTIYVRDCDATTSQAVEHGATVREQPDDFEVTGDRFASIRDPFGVRWTIMTRTAERTDEEIQAGFDEFMKAMTEQG
ncbi:VOC family protein [Granulicoccus sp. GXG6511]|uniref:VOC family protein n=1 Tax=Granulicoccus sp. GXG6511 TaxID=3381351 RepID=UPI003D7E3F66